ncbi:MAG TPA: sulfite exporter TauE/SafE family protein [Fimbriimonadaceae bacterium]|nr:sulfite exporter TauE/SafE family protein [Fimbriimonadaceae bacterium]
MTPAEALLLVGVGAVASGLNAVAGGGSLISFPTLTVVVGLPEKIANATNSVGLWPGSLSGGIGFKNLFEKTSRYLAKLFIPTLLGSLCGALLLLNTSNKVFKEVIPGLILLASCLLLFQPKVKELVQKRHAKLPEPYGWVLQFLVSTYGGYFGAGMGIMMLAAFALYMEGTIHELNAVKNWLGLIINFSCSAVFISRGLVEPWPAVWIVVGALIGGFVAAKVSQRFNPDKLRVAIAIYGFAMTAFFIWRAMR